MATYVGVKHPTPWTTVPGFGSTGEREAGRRKRKLKRKEGREGGEKDCYYYYSINNFWMK